MGTLRRNLDALRATNGELADRVSACRLSDAVRVEPTPAGACSVRVGDRLEASAVDPEREGAKTIDGLREPIGVERIGIQGRQTNVLGRPNRTLAALAVPIANCCAAPTTEASRLSKQVATFGAREDPGAVDRPKETLCLR